VAGRERELADRHAARRMDVGGPEVLHRSAGGGEQTVDLGAGLLFWRRTSSVLSGPMRSIHRLTSQDGWE